jgi:CheY-like chemotaxis protein
MASILVVEDDAAVRDVIADVLEIAGFQVDTAEHGGEALEKLRRSTPAVVLLDLMMPVMGGEDFLREWRRRVPNIAVPTVVLTATLPHVPDPAAALGVEAYLAKPFDIGDLISTVQRFVPEP